MNEYSPQTPDVSIRLKELINKESITSLVNYYAQNFNKLALSPEYDVSQGVTRPGLSFQEEAMMIDLELKAKKDGLGIYQDHYGNRFFYLKGQDIEEGEDVEIHMAGSHIDSVPGGGRFDGTVGVFTAYLALKTLKELGLQSKHTIVCLVLKNEESGGGFGGKPYGGAKALAGRMTEADMQARNDQGGTRAEYLQELNRDPQQVLEEGGFAGFLKHLEVVPERVSKISMIEPHIEQADNLVDYRQSQSIEKPLIGAVEAVCSPARIEISFSPKESEIKKEEEFAYKENFYTVEISGQRAHSGTTPMTKRADSLVGFAKVVEDIQEINESFEGMGKVVLRTLREPREARFAINVVPGKASVDIEIQADNEAIFRRILIQLQEKVRTLKEDVNVNGSLSETPDEIKKELAERIPIDNVTALAAAKTILKVKDFFTKEEIHGLRGTTSVVYINPDNSLTLYLDIRIAQPGYILSAHHRLAEFLNQLGREFPVKINIKSLTDFSKENPVVLDEELQKLTIEACQKLGVESHSMSSWAGHDTAYLARSGIKVGERVIPVAGSLLFIPSTGGSHNPEENAEEKDLKTACQVTAQMLYNLGRD